MLQHQCIQPSMSACAASFAAVPMAHADVLGYELGCEFLSWAALHACSIRQRWDPVTGRTTQGSVSIKKEKEREERARQEALQERAAPGNPHFSVSVCCLPCNLVLHASILQALCSRCRVLYVLANISLIRVKLQHTHRRAQQQQEARSSQQRRSRAAWRGCRARPG